MTEIDLWGNYNPIEWQQGVGLNPSIATTAKNNPGLWGSFSPTYDPKTGMKTSDGWGGTAFGAAQGLFNAWLGMKQYGLAKDQLSESKRQFELNFGAQRDTTNAALADRQAARVASNPGAYQSVSDYMARYGIKG